MKYQRPNNTRKEYTEFEAGKHQAIIQKVTMTKTKKGNDMFRLRIAGKNGESGFYNLVFDTEFVEENLGFILASIEDNGEDIPDLDFDYNSETANFLEKKEVYISVAEEEYQGKIRGKIKAFLVEETFEDEEDYPYEDESEGDSFE
jgi:hypothetical protein